MNTDEAFDLLRDAGVTEDICIQTIRRWLRERKINYEGNGFKRTGHIIDNTDVAFDMLKDAGVSEEIGVQIVRRWLRDGKILDVGTGKRKTEYIANETKFSSHSSEQEKTIRQLKVRLKAQDEHIKGMEKLHQTSINTLIQQRNKLNKEITALLKEKNELQFETKKLLEENINLRNEILKLKEELFKGNKRETEKQQEIPSLQSHDHRQKLGLSKTASVKDILGAYKQLLKITHPDQGGNAKAFHYIKKDYDEFRIHLKQ